jgi:hypothetical protein
VKLYPSLMRLASEGLGKWSGASPRAVSCGVAQNDVLYGAPDLGHIEGCQLLSGMDDFASAERKCHTL